MPKELLHPHPDVDTLLVLDVQYSPDTPVYQWWLAGPPPHGTHPDPAGAWHALFRSSDPFRGYDASTQDYHGPEQATVRGFWRGRWVEHRFVRSEGAGAWEWDLLRGLLEPEAARAHVTGSPLTDR
jgi:hypothetical protein